MKQAFRELPRYRADKMDKLDIVLSVIKKLAAQGEKTYTLRHLFYKLVGLGTYQNSEYDYNKKLGPLVTDARMAGLIDWDVIVDHTREAYLPYAVDGISEALEDLAAFHRLKRQKGQPVYLELWCEKQAMTDILKPLTKFYHIYLVINRGFSSTTAKKQAADRMRVHEDAGQQVVILYLGDHDPSGKSMISVAEESLQEFGLHPLMVPIALTAAQIKKYKLPPQPVKDEDSRAAHYVEKFGSHCWELDALSPKVLTALIKKEVESRIDMDLFRRQLAQEKTDKSTLREFAATFGQDKTNHNS